MKKILITGANSYIGARLEEYLMRSADDFEVDTVGTINGEWKSVELSAYDVIFHVAAIVHTPDAASDLYYSVNRDLAIEIAEAAKRSGVGQLVLMSSMSVFGSGAAVVTPDTKPVPDSDYGRSKLEADLEIEKLQDDGFKVAIVRAPMVYGKGCKGNYNRMEKFALKSPVFPSLINKRDMIYIGNLVDYIKFVIENEVSGILYPKDPQLVCTADMVKKIAQANGHNIHLWGIFDPFVKLLMTETNIFGLVFGDSYCDMPCELEWEAPYDLDKAIKDIYKK